MRKVIAITHVEHLMSARKEKYAITHVLLEDGTEARFYGTNVKVGDSLEVFYSHGRIGCQHPRKPSAPSATS